MKQHPEVTEIEICTDNDFAGRWACEQIKEHYEKEYAVFSNLPPIEGADYGDLAKQAWEKPAETAKRTWEVKRMEDNIKIELLTPLTGNFTSRELERQWEEGVI